MRTFAGLTCCLGFALVTATLGCTHSRRPQINIMLAYAHLEMDEQDGVEPIVTDKGGGRGGVGVDVPIGPGRDIATGFRVGGRFVVSGFREDVGDRVVAGEPDLEIEEFVEFVSYTPQFVASYRLVIGDPARGAFIEPGVGFGITVGELIFGEDLEFGDDLIGTDIDDTETEVGPSLNPFVRGGLSLERVLVGIEGGYQINMLEFDDSLGADPHEWYVGLFIAIQLGP